MNRNTCKSKTEAIPIWGYNFHACDIAISGLHKNEVYSTAVAAQKPPNPVGYGAVAQLIERVVRNDEVRGLIPLSSTIRRRPAWRDYGEMSRRSRPGEGGLKPIVFLPPSR